MPWLPDDFCFCGSIPSAIDTCGLLPDSTEACATNLALFAVQAEARCRLSTMCNGMCGRPSSSGVRKNRSREPANLRNMQWIDRYQAPLSASGASLSALIRARHAVSSFSGHPWQVQILPLWPALCRFFVGFGTCSPIKRLLGAREMVGMIVAVSTTKAPRLPCRGSLRVPHIRAGLHQPGRCSWFQCT